MTTDALLEALEHLLADERHAIAAMDTEKVLALSDEKEAFLARISESPREALRPFAPRLAALKAELRSNCVLLAHARDCVRDALTAAGADVGDASRGRRLSVSG